MSVPPYETHLSIWDLDNCLTDDMHRVHLIDWGLQGNARYNAYDARMEYDQLAHFAVWDMFTRLSTPLFFTGRRERYRDVTLDWIHRKLPLFRDGRLERIRDPLVLMRGNDEELRPAEVKKRMLLTLSPAQRASVIAAFDDVPAIVEMYLAHGIPATVLRVHDPIYTYEKKEL